MTARAILQNTSILRNRDFMIKSINSKKNILNTLPRWVWGIILIIFILSCSSADRYKEIHWEGIEGTTLRVYIRYNLAEELDDDTFEKKIQGILLEEARKRCRFILYNYLQVKNIRDINMLKYIEMQFILMNKVLTSCNDEYCYGFYDFDIENFLKALDKKNKL